MRIISLNTWGGRGGKENLLAFFKKHADYAFVTKGLNVLDFKVLPDEISDHSPLLIEVE